MAGAFEYSSTRPRTLANLLLVIGAAFVLLGAPMVIYGVSLPSTVENEMLPFILLLCGLLIGVSGLALLAIGVRLRSRYPGR
jgi:hypothetical protein